MFQHYLDFEEPIRQLDERILELSSQTDSSQELIIEIENAKKNRQKLIEKIYQDDFRLIENHIS